MKRENGIKNVSWNEDEEREDGLRNECWKQRWRRHRW